MNATSLSKEFTQVLNHNTQKLTQLIQDLPHLSNIHVWPLIILTHFSINIKGHNPLDSSAPLKRGKERETPVKKKPSALKRVILKEREENKRLRTLQETCLSDAEE